MPGPFGIERGIAPACRTPAQLMGPVGGKQRLPLSFGRWPLSRGSASLAALAALKRGSAFGSRVRAAAARHGSPFGFGVGAWRASTGEVVAELERTDRCVERHTPTVRRAARLVCFRCLLVCHARAPASPLERAGACDVLGGMRSCVWRRTPGRTLQSIEPHMVQSPPYAFAQRRTLLCGSRCCSILRVRGGLGACAGLGAPGRWRRGFGCPHGLYRLLVMY